MQQPQTTAQALAATVSKVVAHLNGTGPRPTSEEIRAGHHQLDQAAAEGITPDDVRKHRQS